MAVAKGRNPKSNPAPWQRWEG